MRTRLLLLLALSSFALAVSGCGALRAATARQTYIQNHVRDHVYERPLAQIWPDARQLLFEKGWEVKDTGEGTFTLETDWRYGGDGKHAERYLVQGVEVDAHSSKVMFTRTDQFGGKRDLNMEWELLQRVDPGLSAQIKQDADSSTRKE